MASLVMRDPWRLRALMPGWLEVEGLAAKAISRVSDKERTRVLSCLGLS